MPSTTDRFVAFAPAPFRADFETGETARFTVRAVALDGAAVRAVVRLADHPERQFRLVGRMGEDTLALQHDPEADFDDLDGVMRAPGFETVGTVVDVAADGAAGSDGAVEDGESGGDAAGEVEQAGSDGADEDGSGRRSSDGVDDGEAADGP
jgi:hypothetical protein